MPTIVSVYGSENTRKQIEELISLLSNALFDSGFNIFSYVDVSTGIIKFDKTQFESRSVEETDYTLFLDTRSVSAAAKSAKLKSIAILNSHKKEKYAILMKKNIKTISIDATGIGNSFFIRSPAPAMAGAFAKAFGQISLKCIKTTASLAGEQHDKAAEEGYRVVK